MAGRRRTYPVEFDKQQQRTLERTVAARKSTQSEVQRAKILLTCAQHPDWSDDRVAAHIGCSAGLVRKWRKRWHESHSLEEAPRTGRPRTFPHEM